MDVSCEIKGFIATKIQSCLFCSQVDYARQKGESGSFEAKKISPEAFRVHSEWASGDQRKLFMIFDNHKSGEGEPTSAQVWTLKLYSFRGSGCRSMSFYQVWSPTQLYSVDFSQSTTGV